MQHSSLKLDRIYCGTKCLLKIFRHFPHFLVCLLTTFAELCDFWSIVETFEPSLSEREDGQTLIMCQASMNLNLDCILVCM